MASGRAPVSRSSAAKLSAGRRRQRHVPKVRGRFSVSFFEEGGKTPRHPTLTFYVLLHFMPSYTGSSQYGRVCGLPDIRLFLLESRHKAGISRCPAIL